MSRIAFVSHWDWVLYNFRLPLAKALTKLGCEVVFVCPFGEYVRHLQKAGFSCVHWSIVRQSINPIRELGSILHLIYLYRREGFDAVHHFTIKPILYGCLAARVSGVPFVFNLFSGLGYLFSSAIKARLVRACIMPFLRYALRHPQSYTQFQTGEDREYFVQAGLVKSEHTQVIDGSGVDTNLFRPLPGNAQLNGTPAILMATRLLWDKGVKELVDSARDLKTRGVAARIWIAGDSDSGNPNAIPQEVLRLWQNEGVVEFLGQRSDMVNLLQSASIAVLPTKYNEGVPRFLLEAAAAGLPIIATDIGGCRVVVRHNENGFIIPPGDMGALTGAMARLIMNSGLRDEMGKASRKIAVEQFDEALILAEYVDLYRRVGLISAS